MRRLPVALIALAVAGCGGDNPGSDGGNVTYDLVMRLDANGPDLAVPSIATGTQIAQGNTFQLVGVTSDDYAVVFNNAATGVIPFTGGAATSIGDNAVVVVTGKSVLSWTKVNQKTGIGELRVWTAAGGLSAASVSNSIIADFGGLDDGSAVLYAVATNAGGTTADAYVAKSDLTGAVKVASDIQVSISAANPNPCSGFAIPAGGSFVHVTCDAALPDGGAKVLTATVDAVAADGTVTHLATDVHPFAAVDQAAKNVFVIDANDQGLVFGIGGGPGITVDTMVHTGFFLSDGRLAYDTTAGHVKTAVVGMAPVDVGPTNVTNFIFASSVPASSDGKYVIYYNRINPKTNFTDIYLQPTAPGGATTLTSTLTGAILGDAFTADSSRALFFTDCLISGTGVFGNLTSVAVTGGSPTVHGMRTYSAYAAASGSALVFNDNWRASQLFGTADIEFLADAAKSDPPTLIATRAEATIFLSHDKKKVVYNFLTGPGKEGIYVAPLP